MMFPGFLSLTAGDLQQLHAQERAPETSTHEDASTVESFGVLLGAAAVLRQQMSTAATAEVDNVPSRDASQVAPWKHNGGAIEARAVAAGPETEGERPRMVAEGAARHPGSSNTPSTHGTPTANLDGVPTGLPTDDQGSTETAAPAPGRAGSNATASHPTPVVPVAAGGAGPGVAPDPTTVAEAAAPISTLPKADAVPTPETPIGFGDRMRTSTPLLVPELTENGVQRPAAAHLAPSPSIASADEPQDAMPQRTTSSELQALVKQAGPVVVTPASGATGTNGVMAQENRVPIEVPTMTQPVSGKPLPEEFLPVDPRQSIDLTTADKPKIAAATPATHAPQAEARPSIPGVDVAVPQESVRQQPLQASRPTAPPVGDVQAGPSEPAVQPDPQRTNFDAARTVGELPEARALRLLRARVTVSPEGTTGTPGPAMTASETTQPVIARERGSAAAEAPASGSGVRLTPSMPTTEGVTPPSAVPEIVETTVTTTRAAEAVDENAHIEGDATHRPVASPSGGAVEASQPASTVPTASPVVTATPMASPPPAMLHAPTASALLEDPGVQQALRHQVLDESLRVLQNGQGEAELHIDPPELGRMKMHLSLDNQTVRGFIEVESAAVRAALLADLDGLQASFAEMGLDASQFEIHLMDERRSRDNRDRRGRSATPSTSEDETQETTRSEAAPRRRHADAALDYLL